MLESVMWAETIGVKGSLRQEFDLTSPKVLQEGMQQSTKEQSENDLTMTKDWWYILHHQNILHLL